MTYGEDSLGPQLVGLAVTGALAYGSQSWLKKKPGSPWPLAADLALIPVGLWGMRATRRPYLQASYEAAAAGGVWAFGEWAADTTTTMGGVGKGVPQVWQPFVPSSSGGAAVNRGAAASTARAGIVSQLPSARPSVPYRLQAEEVA